MLVVGAIKLVGQLAVGIGVSTVTKAFIKSITPSAATKVAKVAIEVGSYFIGGVLIHEAGKKWNSDVDKAVEIVKSIKKIKEESKKEESKLETEAE